MSENPVIHVDHIDKTFRLPHEKQVSIKGLLTSFLRGGRRKFERQQVLKNVSFEVEKGEFFGIVGRNGSGKSTLLKLLAGIYSPTKGTIRVTGRLTPFIELGVGFNQELTGRENVFLNGALLGFNRDEMSKMYDSIVEFAELERFMDQKLKNYSSGMQVRLAFSIAIRAKSDILLLDEVLAVGDSSFQQKCYNYFYELKRQKQTVILVTHDMGAVERFCTKAMLIDGGNIVRIGDAKAISSDYERLNLRSAEKEIVSKENNRTGTGQALIDKVSTFNTKTKKEQNTFFADEKIGVEISFVVNDEISKPALGFIFQDAEAITVFATNTPATQTEVRKVTAGNKIVMRTEVDNVFTNGKYSISCAIESKDFSIIYDRTEFIHYFTIGGHALAHAKTHPKHTVDIQYI